MLDGYTRKLHGEIDPESIRVDYSVNDIIRSTYGNPDLLSNFVKAMLGILSSVVNLNQIGSRNNISLHNAYFDLIDAWVMDYQKFIQGLDERIENALESEGFDGFHLADKSSMKSVIRKRAIEEYAKSKASDIAECSHRDFKVSVDEVNAFYKAVVGIDSDKESLFTMKVRSGIVQLIENIETQAQIYVETKRQTIIESTYAEEDEGEVLKIVRDVLKNSREG